MDIAINIITVVGGLALILLGANALTDGAAAIAKRYGISNLVIGLTIVAFGTSAPELVISILSALQGKADMAVGNVVGSNIFNMLMIVGCTALVSPIAVGRGMLSREIPLCIIASVVLAVCANDVLIDHAPHNVISRIDGVVLLCFLSIFMRYTFAIARNTDSDTQPDEVREMGLPKAIVWITGGLAALIGGGELFVDGASDMARMMGVSDSTIGLTLVAGGTSLPELATSIVAALKRNPAMAIGNAVGSCLFNVFAVLAASALISPMHIAGINNVDIGTMLAASCLLWVVGLFFGKRTITRPEGALLVAIQIAYTTWLVCNA